MTVARSPWREASRRAYRPEKCEGRLNGGLRIDDRLAFRRATGLALARLETRVALADHEHFAAATHDFAVAMTLLGGFERRQDFHWNFRMYQGYAMRCSRLF
jgi:hypothetical protein